MRNTKPTSIRIPEEIKEWVDIRGFRNFRSMSAEIVAILSAVKEGEETGDGFENFANPSGMTEAHKAALKAEAAQ